MRLLEFWGGRQEESLSGAARRKATPLREFARNGERATGTRVRAASRPDPSRVARRSLATRSRFTNHSEARIDAEYLTYQLLFNLTVTLPPRFFQKICPDSQTGRAFYFFSPFFLLFVNR